MNGIDLLAEFRVTRSEAAFSELVRRYTNLVYSVGKRRLTSLALTQEAAQLVFIRLAKAAPRLKTEAELAAWLHRTTVHVSIDLWRSETRRRSREERAAAMQSNPAESPTWSETAPILDELLNELNDADRQVILLRFFEQKTMRDLGRLCGITEDAAKMRVSRALERLRTQLSVRGVSLSAAALSALLAERSVEAAPAELLEALAALRVPAAGGWNLGGELPGLEWHPGRTKLVLGLAAGLVVGGVVLVWLRPPEGSPPASSVRGEVMQVSGKASAGEPTAAATPRTSGSAPSLSEPDPFRLLEEVARARRRINSGEMEYEVASYEFSRPWDGTNRLRLKAVFDGNNRRFESIGREYAYTSPGAEAEAATEARGRAEGLGREAAVRAGLLKGFVSHHVTAYDGAARLDYWENDNQPVSTTIEAASKGSSTFLFDPRIVGLSGSLPMSGTIEGCLGYTEARAVRLVGKEAVAETEAWHVEVQSKAQEVIGIWIDVAHPVRVLQYSSGDNVVRSSYDDAYPKNPLPVQVEIVNSRQGTARTHRWIRCLQAQLDVPVAPSSWTLAGLGMRTGTEVVDDRIHRRIGYWTGTGLSEDLPGATRGTSAPPDPAELLAVLDSQPDSSLGLEVAQWILLNTPDGPEVSQAAEVIIQHHIRSPNLVKLAQELARLRPACTRPLLEAMLNKNPAREVRGNACLTLATLRKEAAGYGTNRQATAEARQLFERLSAEFGSVKKNGLTLADLAKPQLFELTRLNIGQPAPEIVGTDMDGQPLKLSDFRGRIVVLRFWSGHCLEAPDLQDLLQHLPGAPVQIVGVNCDLNRGRAEAEIKKHHVTWPSYRDGRDGPISRTWNVDGWPTTFVLDARGIIRYRDLREGALREAVTSLLPKEYGR